MKAIKVTLRKRPLENNKVSLYLDFYPPIQDSATGRNREDDYLGLHILPTQKRIQKGSSIEFAF